MSTADVDVEHPAEAGAGAAGLAAEHVDDEPAQAVRGRTGRARAARAATASSRARWASSAYVSPSPSSPSSVCTSTIARSAHGWWTPTTLSSGGSAKATGVTTTREIRRRLIAARLDREHRHVELEQDPLGVAAHARACRPGVRRRRPMTTSRAPVRSTSASNVVDDVGAVVGVVDPGGDAVRRRPGRRRLGLGVVADQVGVDGRRRGGGC